MIRKSLGAVVVVTMTVTALAAAAQSPQAGTEDNRFTFHRADDGYLRLDGRSGDVSLCTRRTVGWTCQAVPDERTALEAEIARLQTDNVALKRELLAHNLALPVGIRPDAVPEKVDRLRLQLPSDADIDRMMAFVERVWRRLVDMVVSAQRDMMRRS